MGQEELDQLIDVMWEAHETEGLSFQQIRERLKNQGVAEGAIKIIIKELDDMLIDEAYSKSQRSKNINYMIIGFLMAILGFGIIGYSYAYASSGLQGRYIVVPYGIILTGLWLVWRARKEWYVLKNLQTIRVKVKKKWHLKR